MTHTSLSLLDRLKSAKPEATDWGRLQEVYLPLIRRWLGRVPGLDGEAEDLAQEVFVILVREIPRFERRREGRSRRWLRQVTVNKGVAAPAEPGSGGRGGVSTRPRGPRAGRADRRATSPASGTASTTGT